MVTRELPSLLGAGPLQVLGVGVGDGSIDAPLAAALAADGREMATPGSSRMQPRLPASLPGSVRWMPVPWPSSPPSPVRSLTTRPLYPTDLVHFVPSLYYMADLRATLDQALAMLRPGVAGLDLGDVHIDPHGVGELVLDFLVGARTSVMSVEVREQVMAYLAEVELADSPGVAGQVLAGSVVHETEANAHAAW